MSSRPVSTSPCPCGGPAFERCCGPYLAGAALPPTAQTLMRSRYSAFTLRDEPYLLATWHHSTRPQEPLFDADESIRWLGLEIKSALRLRQRKAESLDDPDQNPDHDTVEFVARFKTGGRAHRLHEVSRFVREVEPDAGPNGVARWFYLDGSFPEKKTS